MSTSLVIVAIPEESDRVWKISSEKVPHLTLLHLGETDSVQNLDQIMQFVDHAVTLSEHGPFYLDIDHRGTLGEADADVVFFNKRSWNLKWIRQFRGQLLQNQAIRTAFDAADQIQEAPQEWLPHLTLGYPATPAKKQPPGDDYPLYSICFDRIAVWPADFDGPEFRLEWPDRELEGDLAIMYSDTQKAAVVHNQAKDRYLAQIAQRGQDFLQNTSVLENPTLAEQIKAKIQSILDDVTGDADKDVSLFGDPLIRTKIQSVLEDFYKDPNVDNAVVYDALGKTFIEHFGIKGMKWGRRSVRPDPVAPKAESFVPHGNRRKTQIDVEGGQNHPAHPDAIKVAEAKAKLKKSGSNALSNNELREVANRLQLENQVEVLTSSKGKQFVTRQLQNEGANIARAGVREGLKRGAKRVGQGAATLAVVAA
jgi:2'-5' RNA ligase